MDFELTNRPRFFFSELTKIPHGSKDEKGVSDYVAAFAKEHGLKYVQDDMYNIIVYKDGSAGYEDAAPLVIQAHLDMVCEKNKDCSLDFSKDALKVYVDEDGWLHADGTTLGADDGVGVAYMLAILEDDGLAHPPLECVFTVQEEIGLIGSMNIRKEDIHGRRMISLDGGGETRTNISSAGGCQVDLVKKMVMEKNDDPTYLLGIRGLSGGHSGGEIHKEKGNANQLAARMIKEAMLEGADIHAVSYEGGMKDNAIPREADIVFTSSTDPETLRKCFARTEAEIGKELEFSDAGFGVIFRETEKASERADRNSTDDLIDYAFVMPNGFQHRSMKIENLTVTSLNLGVVSTHGDEVRLIVSVRSAMESGIDNLIRILRVLAGRLGFEMTTSARYPGWTYEEVSQMRDTYAECVRRIYGVELETAAGHGGNECGVFNGLVGGMDIISLGPKASGCHTPDEKLDLESFDRTYKLLCTVISESK